MPEARLYLQLLRPHQWLKNTFVFVGLVFGHAFDEGPLVVQSLVAFVSFCLLSSAVYVVNDYLDRERDRLHPEKSRRPLASGQVSPTLALLIGGGCALLGLALAGAVSAALFAVAMGYLSLNAVYNLGGKQVVLLDVFLIAGGFMLRLLAGTVGLGIAPSYWLLLCGFLLTLFLGFAKRRAELGVLQEDSAHHRQVLSHYNKALLDLMMAVVSAAVVVTYSLYTVSPDTILLHGTDKLFYTVPLVLFGLFRYLYLLHCRGGGGDPALHLLKDVQLQIAVGAWLITTLLLLI
jgi:4-hydroxybenzoate polyprenyltransferase